MLNHRPAAARFLERSVRRWRVQEPLEALVMEPVPAKDPFWRLLSATAIRNVFKEPALLSWV